MAVPFPILIDSGRRWYQDLGLARGSWWSVWGPANVAAYARLLVRGRRPHRPTEADVRQLGGDFVFDREGRLAAVFRPANPDDRPSIEELVSAIEGASTGPDH